MFCREHVVQLHRQDDRIRAAGAELVAIGSGTPNFIAGFRELTGFRGTLLSDPTLSAYRAAGMRRGHWRSFTPLSAAYAVRALARGHMQGRTQGDAAQQGGVLVVLPPGRVVYAHFSKVTGDNAPAEEVVAALERAVGEGAGASA
jgi:peroxiredoxin